MARSSAMGDEWSGSPLGGDADLAFEVRDVRELVAELDGQWKALLERTPLTARQIKDFKQAVLEMGGNALEWGRGEGQEPWALVTSRVGPEDVTVIVRDRGPGFDYRLLDRLHSLISVDNPHLYLDFLEELRRSGGPGDGYGIMLARGLSDDFSYNDRGNEVTLVKRFGPETPG